MIVVGTAAGLVVLDGTAVTRVGELEGRSVDAVAPAQWKRLWAVVDGGEIWRTGDGGTWSRVAVLGDAADLAGLDATCLADTRANHEDGILVGTSQARLARVSGAGDLEVVEAFDTAPGRDAWFTPWGGPPDTRSITEDHDHVYVNVHVGGVLRSSDEGATWQPTLDIEEDVHRVTTGHGRVYAAGARGLSVSEDAGQTWRRSDSGLHATYCRAVTVCGSHLLVSASTGPGGGRSALYRADLEGATFERCAGGLPEWFDRNLDSLCVDALPDGSLAAFGTEAGEVYQSADEGASWARVVTGLGRVRCVLTLPRTT